MNWIIYIIIVVLMLIIVINDLKAKKKEQHLINCLRGPNLKENDVVVYSHGIYIVTASIWSEDRKCWVYFIMNERYAPLKVEENLLSKIYFPHSDIEFLYKKLL